MWKKSEFYCAESKTQTQTPKLFESQRNSFRLEPLSKKISFTNKQMKTIQCKLDQQKQLNPSLYNKMQQYTKQLPDLIIQNKKFYQRKKKDMTMFEKIENTNENEGRQLLFKNNSNASKQNLYMISRPKYRIKKQKENIEMYEKSMMLSKEKSGISLALSQKENKKILQLKERLKSMTENELRINKINLGFFINHRQKDVNLGEKYRLKKQIDMNSSNWRIA